MNKLNLSKKTLPETKVASPRVGDSLMVSRASLSVAKGRDMADVDYTFPRSKSAILPTHHSEVTEIEAVYADGSVRTSSGDVWRHLVASPTPRARFMAVA